MCMCKHKILYTGKTFEGENFFLNFEILWLFVKVFSVNFKGMVFGWPLKQAICENFLCENRIFHQFVKVFSLESFSLCGSKLLLQVVIMQIGKVFCLQLLHGSGWFSMSPLPRLHHHDITPCQDKVVWSHFNTDKFHSLALALTLTVILRPDHLATRHC